MLAFRRAVISSRNHGFHVGAVRVSRAVLDGSNYGPENTSAQQQQQQKPFRIGVLMPWGHTISFLVNCFQNYRKLSWRASAKVSTRDAEVGAGFSEVEASTQVDNKDDHVGGVDDDLASEVESDPDEEYAKYNAQGLGYTELYTNEKDGLKKKPDLQLFNVVMNAPVTASVSSVLDKLVEGGRAFNRIDVSVAMVRLRGQKLYAKALQLSEWAAKKGMESLERDYACRVDLIAKVQGVAKAESYIERIPKEFQTEAVYGTLLANCVLGRNHKKVEEIFNKIRGRGLSLTASVFDQLLFFYRRFNKKKVDDILALMHKENIMPNLSTYKVLIDIKGRSNDIKGMEQTIEHMKASGVKPDLYFQASVARHYIFAGYNEKAESILREMEGNDIEVENRAACVLVLPLYASLGKEEDVTRVWSTCEKKFPSVKECVSVIGAWGELGHIDKAEEVFEIMHKSYKKLTARCYNAMLKVYAKSSNLTKAKELLKRMSTDGCNVGPTTWDVLVKMYLGVGEVEKADSLLQKAAVQSSEKPTYTSYLAILENYGKRGDIDNAENIFELMRRAGYVGRVGMYRVLLNAYVVAKAPAYGFRQRLKADGIFPGPAITWQLATVDSYSKAQLVELLD